MSADRVSRAVEKVLEEHPLPPNYEDLQPGQHRRVEREAAEAGLSPRDYWSEVIGRAHVERMKRRDAEERGIRLTRLR